MLGDKPAGVKILWIWAIGTAAVLVTSVVRTRMQDMEKIMNADQQLEPQLQQQQQQQSVESVILDDSLSSDGMNREEKL